MFIKDYVNQLPRQEIMRLNYKYLKNLSHTLRELKASGNLTIGFTHGVFNHIHEGHKYFIANSQKQCDLLIVALDSDEKPLQYKVPSQKLQGATIRLHNFRLSFENTFPFINYLPFSDENFGQLYKLISPDMMLIGANFGAKDQIIERTNNMKIKLIEINQDQLQTSLTYDTKHHVAS